VSAVRAILGRELRIAFTTPLAWTALGAFALVTALLFWLQLLAFEGSQTRALALDDKNLLSMLDFNELLLGSVYGHAQLLLVFLVPVFTMRAFADEARQGTLDLLASAPVTTTQLAFGKLLGAVAIVAAASLVLLVYPALLAIFGRAVVEGDGVVDWPQAFTGVLGFFLVGAVYASIGTLLSSASSSPAGAAMVTVLVLMGLWLAGNAALAVEGALGHALAWLAPSSHLERFVRGVVAVSDVTYFASFIAACAIGAQRVLEARRRT
jgi:ABC-2 type transport system permease protein